MKNLATGEIWNRTVEETISVAWAADSRTLFFTEEDHARRAARLNRVEAFSDSALGIFPIRADSGAQAAPPTWLLICSLEQIRFLDAIVLFERRLVAFSETIGFGTCCSGVGGRFVDFGVEFRSRRTRA